jgi:hypothetical protein
MTRRVLVFAGALALLFAGVAGAQYPMLDLMAEKVVQKYALAAMLEDELYDRVRSAAFSSSKSGLSDGASNPSPQQHRVPQYVTGI